MRLTILPLVAAVLLLSGIFTGPDPSPYTRIIDRAEWKSPAGRRLQFCLLGYRGEERARTMAVYEKTRGGWRRVYLDLDRGFNPWAIRLAELDGDGLPELAVGVYKKTRFDPAEKNRLFIYDWKENDTLFPKWLGSRLGLDLVAFALARGPDGIDRLLTVEHSGEDRLALRQYHWNGFGFSHDLDRVRLSRPQDFASAQDRLVRQMNDLAKKGVEP